MKRAITLVTVSIMLVFSGTVSADLIRFHNGAILEGQLISTTQTHIRFESDGKLGNYSRDDVESVSIGDYSGTTPPPNPEPEDLDQPTAWQDGDPPARQMTVPEIEPNQISGGTPARPLEDAIGDTPGPDYVWVTGYWWWTSGTYVWVPGYWTIPPHPTYVYNSGYWRFHNASWVYIRGGWAYPGGTTVVVYARPRPVVVIGVFPWPSRIIARHMWWRSHRHRHHHHYRSLHRGRHHGDHGGRLRGHHGSHDKRSTSRSVGRTTRTRPSVGGQKSRATLKPATLKPAKARPLRPARKRGTVRSGKPQRQTIRKPQINPGATNVRSRVTTTRKPPQRTVRQAGTRGTANVRVPTVRPQVTQKKKKKKQPLATPARRKTLKPAPARRFKASGAKPSKSTKRRRRR